MNTNNFLKFLALFLLGTAFVFGFLALKITLFGNSHEVLIPQPNGVMNLWVIFLTGLTVGGLTCLAVQGGLLASVIAVKEDGKVQKGAVKKNTVFPTLAFLGAKLLSYTILGFILGGFGGAIGISPSIQIIMQLLAGLYMIAIALNLLNIHPIFRYAVLQPPKFLTRRVRSQSRSSDLFAPGLLGAMTIFIPCGTTLAMEALAISSANPFIGAIVMATFILGTTPLFFGIGWVTSLLGNKFRTRFLKIAAVAVIYLGLTSINGALVVSGFPITIQSITRNFQLMGQPKTTEKLYSDANVSQIVEINVLANGYSPSYIRVKKGSLVTIKIVGKNVYTCASAFRVPSLGISKNLQPNESYAFSFTAKKIGKIPFTCSMGMYGGAIEVI